MPFFSFNSIKTRNGTNLKAKDILNPDETPLIDTVERLQGQDVDCIILTFASSDNSYIKEVRNFLFNRNRLNVMISRAKTKVVIFGCESVQKELKTIMLTPEPSPCEVE